MKLPGKLTIVRAENENGPLIRLHVRDDEARTNFLTITLTPQELMMALTGRPDVECSLIPVHLDRVGTAMQTKIVHVDAPQLSILSGPLPGTCISEDEITALLAPHEVDGWIATRTDMTNPRRRCEGSKQAVTFCRWIKQTEMELK